MDCLYANLDNYNEEETIAELRNENADLKAKLQEYTESLEKLQKEFDKLSSEHKKLELNYSSLLKTAKAEIERKTQIITNLNIEKDAMVLNSIQNRNFSNRPRYFNNSQGSPANKPDIKPDNKTHDPNVSTVQKSNIVERKEPIKEIEKTNRCSDTKENVMQYREQHKETHDKPKETSRIMDRRKSMPAFSQDVEEFSTDDEHVHLTGQNHDSRDRSYERSHKKSSEYSRDRHYDNESRRSSRSSRNYPEEKSRYRDKSAHSQRFKNRYDSPDTYRRSPRDSYDDYYDRSEDRRRRYESPPKERSRERYSRKSRDSYIPSHERNPYPDHDRYKPRNHDKFPVKHKIPNDYEEPSKRMKMEMHHRNYESERWRSEQQIHDPYEDLQFSSCQSPDSLYFEASPNHQMKEIKLTPTTKLDDPRMLSDRYEIKKNGGKVTLRTVHSRQMVVQPIDKAKWDIPTVSIPEPTNQLLTSASELFNQIYMDIDNPVAVDNTETHDPNTNIYNSTETRDSNTGIHNPIKKHTAEVTYQPANSVNTDIQTEKMCTENIKSYKIPKINKSEVKEQSIKTKETVLEKDSKSSSDKNFSSVNLEKISDKCDVKVAPKVTDSRFTNARAIVEGDLELSDEASDCAEPEKVVKSHERSKRDYKSKDTHNREEKQITKSTDDKNKELKTKDVASEVKSSKSKKKSSKDSKENNDDKSQTVDKVNRKERATKSHSEVQVEVVPVTEKVVSKKEEKKKEHKSSEAKEKTNKRKDKCETVTQVLVDQEMADKDAIAKISIKILPVLEETKEKHIDVRDVPNLETIEIKENVHKKTEKTNNKLPIANVTDKTTRRKGAKDQSQAEPSKLEKVTEVNDKQDPKTHIKSQTQPSKLENVAEVNDKETKNIKNKFSELFGDSNSLISPEDLGLSAAPPPSAQTVPYFEDAQDAIDVKLKEKPTSSIPGINQVEKIPQSNPVIESNLLIALSEDISKNETPATTNTINIQDIYENLEVGDPTIEKDVVKTIIISSGVQPTVEPIQIIPQEIRPVTNIKTVPATNICSSDNIVKPIPKDLMQALATSTPYKPDVHPELDTKTTDSSCNSNNTKDSIECAVNSLTNVNGKANDADIPDVRIFVRRRRKVLKK